MATNTLSELTLENDLASFTIAIVLVRLPETELEADKQYSREEIARAINNLDEIKNMDYFVSPCLLGHAIVIFERYLKRKCNWETNRDYSRTMLFAAFRISTRGTTILSHCLALLVETVILLGKRLHKRFRT